MLRCLSIFVLAVVTSGCVWSRILARNVDALGRTPEAVPNKIRNPVREDVRLAVLWIGHATALVQLDDVFVLTDPVFTEHVGVLSRRLVEPGLAVDDLPPIDVAVVSHMHFDHLSYGSLDLVESKVSQLLVPRGGLVYVPNYRFRTDEVARSETFVRGDLRITAVPVKHVGFRYGADAAWTTEGFTGWVIEYHGLTVYFGGDTAYDAGAFAWVASRFSKIDLAILPIAPVDPASFARATHVDGREAVRAFLDLRALHMVPVHYDTFAHGVDRRGYAVQVLREAMDAEGLDEERIHILPIGGQLGLYPRPAR